MLLSDESASRARREAALPSLLAAAGEAIVVMVVVEGDEGLAGSTQGSDGEEVPFASATLSLVVGDGIWVSFVAGWESFSSASALVKDELRVGSASISPAGCDEATAGATTIEDACTTGPALSSWIKSAVTLSA
jgi:hypothetical protein